MREPLGAARTPRLAPRLARREGKAALCCRRAGIQPVALLARGGKLGRARVAADRTRRQAPVDNEAICRDRGTHCDLRDWKRVEGRVQSLRFILWPPGVADIVLRAR